MKKLLSLLLASAMVLALLAGCGGAPAPAQTDSPPADTSTDTSTDGSGSGQTDAGNPDPATPAGPIKVAALSSGYETTYPGMWQEVCEAFAAETGIEVQLTLEKNLEDVIGPSMQGGDYPDVVLLAPAVRRA